MKNVNFDGVNPFTGESQQLPAGGYKCIIKNAKCETLQNGKEQLLLAIDIAEGEHKDFFTKKFNELKISNKEAKYPNGGIFRIFTEDYNDSSKSSPILAGVKTSVEASNPGFKWDNDETKLKDKKIGVVFAGEEFEASDGTIKIAVKPKYPRSWDKVEEAEIPKVKELKNKSNDLDGEFITIDDTEELPF